MNIGLVFDLRDEYLARGWSPEAAAEFDAEETIAAIAAGIVQSGHAVERIGGLAELVPRLAAGQRWDLVFNLAEGCCGSSREAQVPALLEAWQIPCTFSDATVMALCQRKSLAKRVLRDLGLPTPDFAVVDDPGDVQHVTLPYPLFVKPEAEGSSKGIDSASIVHDPAALARRCAVLRARFAQPVLVETCLPGREFTVGLLGTGMEAVAVGALEVVPLPAAEPGAYTFRNKEECRDRIAYRLTTGPLAEELAVLALAAWRGVGGRDAGRIDFRLDADGRPAILEINPLPGLRPGYSDLPLLCAQQHISHGELIRRILASAAVRCGAV